MSLLKTNTKILIQGISLGIYTWYKECLGYLEFWIKAIPVSVEGVPFKEGELGYIISGSSDFFFLNSHGDLMVNSTNVDKYEINLQGDITTNEDFCGNPII